MGDENLTDATLVTRALHRGGAREIGRGGFPRALENRAQQMRIALHRGRDDGARVEVDAPFVVSLGRSYAERSGLPAQIEKLEDVVDAELAEWSFDRH